MTDDATVADIRDEVTEIDDPETLEEMLAAEQDGKDRTTAKDAITARLDALEGTDADDEDEDEDLDASQRIRVKAPSGGHVAGYSFGRDEVKIVPANAKVRNAIMRGKLQRVP